MFTLSLCLIAAVTGSLLAQAGKLTDVEPGYVRDWLIVLGCVLGLVLLVVTILDRFRPKSAATVNVNPSPLSVEEVEKLATRTELESVREEIEKDLAAMREDARQERAKSHEEIVAVHNRIDALVANTASMKGHLEEIAGTMRMLLNRALGTSDK